MSATYSTSESPTAVLTAVLGVTEAAWAACERGEADIEDIAAALGERRELLARLGSTTTFTADERQLAGRIRNLDQQLLGWCDDRKRELASALADLPRRAADASASSERLLSDFA